ncbi:MAG TPA: hypothetical protein VG819_14240 [Rhizomicrobium sp.]|jgi:hypothetical protein|nr:hypothetical protein [Rhizomicrobium sp.]
MRKIANLMIGATAAAVLLLPTAGMADPHSEIVTAGTHAGLAVAAGDIATVHQHLHHTLNCLVGPGGNGFDAKELNPCAQAGKGAIPDASDPAKKAALEAAAEKTREGIADSTLAGAQRTAADVAAMLKKQE